MASEDALYPARKRPRLQPSPSLACSQSPQWTTLAPLETLPGEILDIILNMSREASLIHASKHLWLRLPPFVAYTKKSAFEGLLPLKEWKDHSPITCRMGEDIAKMQSYLTPEAQAAIQEQIFSTYWFTEEHVHHVRQILLNWTIFKACAVYFEHSPSKSQNRRIKAFVENQRLPDLGTDLNLRLRCENSRLVYLTATAFEIEVSERRNSFFQAFEFRVLDFGNTVPDFLLQHPLTEPKKAMIRGICKWQDTKTNSLQCNLELLSKMILDCIIFDQINTFYELLKLAGSTSIDLNLLHVERIVILGRARMLTPLLKQTWREKTQNSLSDIQLVALIDHAKVNEYPNWSDSTRILAMEVAAMWKIAEVERSGGSVTRVLNEWPPRLSITLAGESNAQSWFIPKDPRHEVDWESNEFRGWIQMRMR